MKRLIHYLFSKYYYGLIDYSRNINNKDQTTYSNTIKHLINSINILNINDNYNNETITQIDKININNKFIIESNEEINQLNNDMEVETDSEYNSVYSYEEECNNIYN